MRTGGRTRLAAAAWLLGTALCALPAGAQTREDTAQALHLLRRATWGVRPADLAAVLSSGRAAWLDRQLNPAAIADPDVAARLQQLPLAAATMAELYRDFTPLPAQVQAAQRAQQMQGDSGRAPDAAMTPAERRERQQRSPQRLLAELVTAKIARSVYSERQLEDVMTDFWFNHFNVFFNKGQDRYLVSDYERSAIRPHVFGTFEDMLLATAQHPAMLFYLDNWTSVYVDTMALRRLRPGQLPQQARTRGLNENYARELLELHTLGVDGGYTQQDVIEVARAFTGWTFQPPPRQLQLQPERTAPPVEFLFRAQLHDRGEKVVLGTVLPAGRGIEDGRAVIRMLAQHPATARFIATKLAERFVADAPPAAVVDQLAAVFTRTNGDLREVTRALFSSDMFYRPEYYGAKVKTPYELVVSALRVTRADVGMSRRTIELLRTMGHAPYTEPAPTGFPVMSEDWVNTGAMLNRMNFGLDLAAARVDGVRITPAALLSASDRAEPLLAVLGAVLPGIDTQQLAQRMREDAQQQAEMQPRARISRALGLALGSPDFQRR